MRCGKPASTRLVTTIEHEKHARITDTKPRFVVSYYCPDHSSRAPEYNFGTVRRTKHSLSHDVAWGGME